MNSRNRTPVIPAGRLRLSPGWGFVVSASELGLPPGELPASLRTEDFIGNGYAFQLFQRTAEGGAIYVQEMGSTTVTVINE